MMTGAVVLLIGALVPAVMGADDAPAWLSNASLVIGYGFLAYGFLLAMRARSEAKEKSSATSQSSSEAEKS